MMNSQQMLPAIVGLPLVAAAAVLVSGRVIGRLCALVAAAAACITAWMTASLCSKLAAQGWRELLVWDRSWVESLGIHARLSATPLGLFFALLIAGVGALIGVFSFGYMRDVSAGRLGRFYAALLVFMGSMLGVALSGDLVLLFVFWELTSISSFLLIGYWHEEAGARKGAATALLVTGLGGLAMLAGFILVGVGAGTYNIDELVGSGRAYGKLVESGLALPAMGLILLGAFTKSAQLPFHFWLPGAMAAPTPVSAYLHAATMVKAGVFLVARLDPLFAGSGWWPGVLMGVGLITMVFSAFAALGQNDLKAMLARTTVAALGVLMMVVGLGVQEQVVVQTLNHALYKGALFLVAGIVEHAVHARDIRKLGGLRRAMPVTFLVCLLAVASMAGLPPMLGCHAKELFYERLLAGPLPGGMDGLRWVLIAGVVVGNAAMTAAGLKLLVGVFFGARKKEHERAHEAGMLLWFSPAVLVGGALGLGLLPDATAGWINDWFVAGSGKLHLAWKPDHPGPLALSGATLALAVMIYLNRGMVRRILDIFGSRADAQKTWDAGLEVLTRSAGALSGRWQNGSLGWYLTGTLVFLVGVVGWSAARSGVLGLALNADLSRAPWYGVALCGLAVAATFAAAGARTRLGAGIALTAVGYLVAMLFVVYRSPDILLTQVLIETVSTIFFLLVVFFLPSFKSEAVLQPARRAVNFVVSAGVGVTMGGLLLLCTSPGLRETDNLSEGFLAKSLAQGGGRNAVNVVIVDVRAMDTAGEVTVLTVVGLCIFGLLRAGRRRAA